MARTVFDLANVANEKVANWYLEHLAAPDGGELVFVFDLALKSAELSLFPPVVERRHQDDDHDGDQDRDAFDPFRLRVVFFVLHICNDDDINTWSQ